MCSFRRIGGLLFCSLLLPAAGHAQEANPLPSSQRPTTDAYRLLLESTATAEGLQVVRIQPESPVLDMESAERSGLRGIMEVGDVIVAVDGQPLDSTDRYFAAMERSAERRGLVELTVVDVSTGARHRWKVQAAKVLVPAQGDPIGQKRKVHFLIIGLTDDAKIGAAMDVTAKLWHSCVENIDDDRLGNVRLMTGAECRAAAILTAVRNMEVAARDTLFCVYCGHGAFDPSRAAHDDPSRGHHLQIRPTGDLMRKSLSDALIAKDARLTVLITDTCNIQDRARPAVAMVEEQRTVIVMGSSPFDQLLFNWRGVVDISGTDFGQFGFCQPGYGAWFSVSAIPVLEQHRDWQSAFEQLSRVVELDFQQRKASHSDIAQAHFTPRSFRLDVRQDEPVTAMFGADPPEQKQVTYRVRRER